VVGFGPATGAKEEALLGSRGIASRPRVLARRRAALIAPTMSEQKRKVTNSMKKLNLLGLLAPALVGFIGVSNALARSPSAAHHQTKFEAHMAPSEKLKRPAFSSSEAGRPIASAKMRMAQPQRNQGSPARLVSRWTKSASASQRMKPVSPVLSALSAHRFDAPAPIRSKSSSLAAQKAVSAEHESKLARSVLPSKAASRVAGGRALKASESVTSPDRRQLAAKSDMSMIASPQLRSR
jgi:hypothetical protein